MNAFHKFCNWYFSKKALPYWCILLFDCASVYLSGLIVFYIQHGGLTLAQHFWPLTLGPLVVLMSRREGLRPIQLSDFYDSKNNN